MGLGCDFFVGVHGFHSQHEEWSHPTWLGLWKSSRCSDLAGFGRTQSGIPLDGH